MTPSPAAAKAEDAAFDARSIINGMADSFRRADRSDDPYRHWTLSDVFGPAIAAALSGLDFPAPDLGGVSGARELHNDTREYFDQGNIARHPVCRALAEAFQDEAMVKLIAEATGAKLDGCYLRIEFAQDVDGFWLQPHTDLGVKKLTMLYYLADGEEQDTLGTDIYRDAETWEKRSAFEPDTALVFVPSGNTWHGFSPRTIQGVRRSVIINYVTDEWRAREQLAYPQTPVRA
ncbi:MAG: 2OG-Fe(II) oxygenase [Caulobacteraceae bacterium]|nr:2OG-Fe(II) oxygenase [Caulobacteraceae bacterium]